MKNVIPPELMIDPERTQRILDQIDQIAQAFQDALVPLIRTIESIDTWMNALPDDVRQALINAGARDARKERHRRRYQRMMERGRRRRAR